MSMAKVKNARERRARRNGDKQRHWRTIVAEQQRGGGTVRDFCRERGINENSFYHWRKELRLRDRETDSDATPSPPRHAKGRPPVMAPVVVIDEPADAATQHSQDAATQTPATAATTATTAIEISLRDGTTVRVPPDSTREQLENVFAVLEPVRC